MSAPGFATLLAAALVVGRVALVAHGPDVVDAGLAAVACGLAAWWAGGPVWLGRALLATAGVLVLAVGASSHPRLSLYAVPAVLSGFGFFVVGQRLRRDPWLAAAAGGAVCVHAATMLYQRFVSWPAALAAPPDGADPSTMSLLSALRPVGLSLSPDLAGGLCLLGGLWWLAFAHPRAGAARAGALAAAGLCLLGLVVARSNGVILLLAGGAWWFAVGHTRNRWVMGLGVALPTAVLLGRGLDPLLHSAGERWANWQTALSLFAARPATGWGLGRFAYGYAQLRPPGSNETLYAHSTPLTLAAEAGLGGLVLGVGLVALGLWLARAVWRAEGTGARLFAVAGLCAVGRLFIDYDGQVGQTAAVVALAVGAAVGERPAAAAWTRRGLAAAAAGAAVLALVLSVRGTALAGFADDGAWLHAFAPYAGTDPEVRVAEAAHRLRTAARCGSGPACDTARAELETALQAALDVDEPVPAARVLAGRYALLRGDAAAAQARAEQALALDPGLVEGHRLRVEALVAQGHDAGPAVAEAARWVHRTVRAELEALSRRPPPRR